VSWLNRCGRAAPPSDPHPAPAPESMLDGLDLNPIPWCGSTARAADTGGSRRGERARASMRGGPGAACGCRHRCACSCSCCHCCLSCCCCWCVCACLWYHAVSPSLASNDEWCRCSWGVGSGGVGAGRRVRCGYPAGVRGKSPRSITRRPRSACLVGCTLGLGVRG